MSEVRGRPGVAAHSGRRNLQLDQSVGVRVPREGRPGQTEIHGQGHAGLGALLRAQDQESAQRVSGQLGQALRGALVALEQPDRFLAYSYRVFETYWGEDKEHQPGRSAARHCGRGPARPAGVFERSPARSTRTACGPTRTRSCSVAAMYPDHVRQRAPCFLVTTGWSWSKRAEAQYLARFTMSCSPIAPPSSCRT